MTERILIAEDDPAIADSVGYSLRACGYPVDVVGNGEAVLESGPGSYDLLILDVMLPGLSGVEVCRRVRERSAVPVLMLTALGGEADRVVGLEAGAVTLTTEPPCGRAPPPSSRHHQPGGRAAVTGQSCSRARPDGPEWEYESYAS